jgi:hypothetical protein
MGKTGLCILALLLGATPSVAYEKVKVTSENGRTVMTQGSLELSVSPKEGISAARIKDGNRTEILSGGRFAVLDPGGKDLLAGSTPDVQTVQTGDGTGPWNAAGASMSYLLSDGAKVFVLCACLVDDESFVIDVALNAGKNPLRIREVHLLEGRLNLGEGEVRVLANTKMWNTTVSVQDNERVKSAFHTALYNRGSRTGAVLGAMTAETASWVQTRLVDGAVQFRMVADYGPAETGLPGAGVLVIRPGQQGIARFAASTGPFLVSLPKNIHEGLESYGRAVRKYNNIKPYRPIPCGWCSWNAFGWIMNEKQMYETLEVVKKHRLPEYGFNTFQVDDGWQCGWRCSGDWRPNPRRFPNGIKPIADAAKAAGMDLGLWIGAFQDEDWDKSAGPDGSLKPDAPAWMKEAVPVLLNYPELMTVREGKPTGRYDLSKPEFLKHLKETQRRLTSEWGARHVKADFLYGGDVQADANRPAHDIYRRALSAIRSGEANGTYLMTCVGYEWKSLGITDGQRVGNDVSPSWQGFYPSARCAPGRYFLNGNFWWNDLDQLHLAGGVDANGRQEGLPLNQARAWAAFFALYGGVTFTGDRLDRLTPERMKLLTQCMPPTGMTARPLDLFDVLSDRRPELYCGIWAMKVEKPFGDYHVIGAFNWTKEKPQTRKIKPADLGYKAGDRLLVYDYWQEKLLAAPDGGGQLEAEVQPTSCRLLVLHKVKDEPMFVSSDRHLTAGAIDVAAAKYDAASRTLAGKSVALVSDVPFRYMFHVPAGMKIVEARFDGRPAEVKLIGKDLAVVTFTPSKAQIEWSVKF